MLTQHELASAPVGWWWWRERNRRGRRASAAWDFGNARELAGMVLPHQDDCFDRSITMLGFSPDGVPGTTLHELTRAVDACMAHHDIHLTEVIDTDAELAVWFRSADPITRLLVPWLAVAWLMTVHCAGLEICDGPHFAAKELRDFSAPLDAALALGNYAVGRRTEVVGAHDVDVVRRMIDEAADARWHRQLVRAGFDPSR